METESLALRRENPFEQGALPISATAEPPLVFSLHNAELAYGGRVVLDNVTLKISPGERVALVGKSGVGKSTLLAALREQRPQGVAWCPQHPGLVPMLKVYHNIYMGGLQRHSTLYNLLNLIKPLTHPLGEVRALAKKLGLEDCLLNRVEQLSGGQLQRVAIGRALYQQQAVFLGDEPVSAVDDYQSECLLQFIVEQHETLVLALHDVDLALRFCDRIIGLKNAAIVFDAPSSTLTAAELRELYC